MKKAAILLILSFTTLIGYSQIKGIDFSSAPLVVYDEQLEAHWGELIKLETDGGYMYTIIYQNTAVGLKRLIEKAEKILSANNLSLYSPDSSSDLFASFVDGIHDYSNLHLAISVDESEIVRLWYYNGYRIILGCTSDVYAISFFKD